MLCVMFIRPQSLQLKLGSRSSEEKQKQYVTHIRPQDQCNKSLFHNCVKAYHHDD